MENELKDYEINLAQENTISTNEFENNEEENNFILKLNTNYSEEFKELNELLTIKNQIKNLVDSTKYMIKKLKWKSRFLHYLHVISLFITILLSTIAGFLTFIDNEVTINISMIFSFITSTILALIIKFEPGETSIKLTKFRGKLENIMLKLEDPHNEYLEKTKLNKFYKKYAKKVINLNVKIIGANKNYISSFTSDSS